MGFLSDLRNDDPELAESVADGFESILYLGAPGNSVTTTPTTLDSQGDRSERGSRYERDTGPTRYYERAEANGGPDAKSVLRYPDGLLAIELLYVS